MSSPSTPIFATTRMRSGLIVAAILISLTGLAQPQQTAASASLHGTIYEGQKPVADALLELHDPSSPQNLTTYSDAQGKYAFNGLPAGMYSLRVTKKGYAAAATSPITIGANESKTFDANLVVEVAGANATPQFFDPPQFTVSGVTDTTSAGGHGSDMMVRAQDSMAKQTAMLGKPANAAAASNFSENEGTLRASLVQNPQSFEANHKLGKFLVDHGEARAAIPYLDSAAKINGADYENSYDLARAHAAAGNVDLARREAQTLLAAHDNAELHHLLGDIDEHAADPLAAVRQYQRAAELEPSEPYLFDWGSELLAHHAPEPALEVFNRGSRLFPHSTRMLIGQGAAWFASGAYDKAVRSICKASDENPNDPSAYLFLGMMQGGEIASSEEVSARLRRFAKLQPDNAQALYYYATALLKSGVNQPSADSEARSLLDRAVQLDPRLAPAALQLGVLYAREGDLTAAVSNYQKAVEADPKMEDAHYRLSQAYRQLGNTDKAKEEAAIYQQLQKESAANAELERREMRQFVYTLRDQPASQKQ